MKKGFTLVELLAVITILSIIMLIAVPIFLNIINAASSNSRIKSIEIYGRAIENAVAAYYAKYPEKDYVTYKELEEEKLIDYKGAKVECETTQIIDRVAYLDSCKVNGKQVEYVYSKPVSNMLTDVRNATNVDSSLKFLNTNVKSASIKELNIKTNKITVPEGYESTDCSYNKDSSVICYWKEYENDSGYYEMNIAANGEIYTPYNSNILFKYLGYDKMQSLDLTGLNTNYTFNMENMFREAGYKEMTTLNLGDKFDTHNAKSMSYMFSATGYTEMKELNLGDKFDTHNVTTMDHMFGNAGFVSMIRLNLGDKFDTSNVTTMRQMFYGTGYTKLTVLNLGDKFDTSNVTDMYDMFCTTGYTAMTTLNLGKKFVIPVSTNTKHMFYNCGTIGVLTSIVVPNETLKTKILSLGDNIPSWWNTNNIIQVQTN